jgi:hypothetical protein
VTLPIIRKTARFPLFTLLAINKVLYCPAHYQRVAVFQFHFGLFARLHHGNRLLFYSVICPVVPNVVCLLVLSLLLETRYPFLECCRYWQNNRAVSICIFLLKEINDEQDTYTQRRTRAA